MVVDVGLRFLERNATKNLWGVVLFSRRGTNQLLTGNVSARLHGRSGTLCDCAVFIIQTTWMYCSITVGQLYKTRG